MRSAFSTFNLLFHHRRRRRHRPSVRWSHCCFCTKPFRNRFYQEMDLLALAQKRPTFFLAGDNLLLHRQRESLSSNQPTPAQYARAENLGTLINRVIRKSETRSYCCMQGARTWLACIALHISSANPPPNDQARIASISWKIQPARLLGLRLRFAEKRTSTQGLSSTETVSANALSALVGTPFFHFVNAPPMGEWPASSK